MNSGRGIGNNGGSPQSSTLSRSASELIIAVIAGAILLVIEYRTGFFVQTLGVTKYFWPTTFAVVQILLLVSFEYTFVVWLRPNCYTRERFALAALFLVIGLTLALFTSILIQFLPWHLFSLAIQALLGESSRLPKPGWAEYALLVVIYVLVVKAIFNQYTRWKGLKSVEQYRREQRNEPISFVAFALEGATELVRIITRKPPLALHSETDSKEYVRQLETVTDSLAWKDQAKELLRLSSSVYDFTELEDWHDRPGCWVGSNVKTGDLVCLYPIQSAVTDAQLASFIDYVDRIAAADNKEIDELIVAVKDDMAPEVTAWNGRLIRFESESTLLDSLVDFKDYENEIRRRVLISRMTDSELSIDSVYVASRCLHVKTGKIHDDVEAYIRQWLEEPGQRQLALLGEYGQGKSTAALMLTYHLLCKSGPSLIPILVELRGRSPRNQTRLGLLGDWASQYRIQPQALERLLDAGRLLIIFEGFDEMALVGDADMRLAHFRTLWTFCYPKAKILITGRPNLFLDEEEMKKALGISEPRGNQPYCEVLRLEPFNLSQIEAALRARKPLVRNQICSFANENSRFRELVARPSLLHIVSELWEKEKLSESVERLSSAYVMGLFIRHSYLRQGLKEDGAPAFAALNIEEREYFMRGVATYMAAQQLPNQISGKQLNEAIEALLDTIPDAVSTAPSAMSIWVREPLKLRVDKTEHGMEHLKVDVRACGILVDDPSSPGTFRFGHKSFMEYLFASVLAEYINEDSPLQARPILTATHAEIRDILNLPVSIGFLAELIGSGKRSYAREDSPAEQANQFAVELAFAARLFYAISGGRLLGISRKLALFDRAFIDSAGRLPRIQRLLIYFFSPNTLFVAVAFAIVEIVQTVIGSVRLLDEVGSELPFMWLTLLLLIVLSGTIVMMSFAMPTRLRSRRQMMAQSSDTLARGRMPFKGTLGLWNHLCKEVGLQDQVLHRFAGTWWLPWAKNRPFDFFLAESRSEEQADQVAEDVN